MDTCAVVIINYNTGKLLQTTVTAVVEDSSVSQLVVVDNCSTDGSMKFIAETNQVKKYQRKHNYGFAKSCNYGRCKIQSNVVLFLNPDCILPKKEILQELLKKFNTDNEVAIVGCRVNNPDGSEQRASRRRLPTFWRAIKTFTGLERLARFCHCFAGINLNHQPMPKTWQSVEAISGAFILMRTGVFDQLHGFDEKYPMHFEDLDLFKRTQDLGYKIAFNPQISVVHHQGTSSQSNPKVAEMKKQGLQRYFYKHCSRLTYLFVKMLG